MLLLIRDTMAWWGAIAWFITLSDTCRWLGMNPRPKLAHAIHPVAVAMAMCALSVGLILIGVTLPLTTRIDSFEAASLVPRTVGWTLIAGSGWGFVCARAAKPGTMIMTAGLAFGGMAVAAIATVGG